jgi:hypothetical protein
LASASRSQPRKFVVLERVASWLNFPAVKDAVLFLLAIYGAALSTFKMHSCLVQFAAITQDREQSLGPNI